MFWRAPRFYGNKANRRKSSSNSKRTRFLTTGIERLEWRRVLTANFNTATGVLTVDGTVNNDVIAVAPTKNSLNAQVTINGQIQSITVSSGPSPVTSIPLSSINEVDVFGHEGDDSITITGIDKTVTVDGGIGSNRLAVVGHTANNAFILPGTGSDLMVNGNAYSFSNVILLNVFGQGGQDMLTVQAVPTLPVKFNGGANVDTIVAPDVDNTWNVTVVNGGNLTPTGQGTLTFGNVENLTGGTSVDTFNLSARASLADNINGGDGTDSLSYAGYTTPVTFQLKTKTGSGLVGYGTGVGSLLNVESIAGGSANDTLVGFNATGTANTWNILAANSGTVVNQTISPVTTVATINYSSFESLTGSPQSDKFVFADGSRESGKIDGGAGSDKIDFTAFTTAVNVNLASKTYIGVGSGGFANIEAFIGTATPTLSGVIGPNLNQTWNITTVAAVSHVAIGGIDFTGFGNLTGGTLNDAFVFANGAAVAGKIDGGTGTDTLNYSNYMTAITVNLQTNIATGTTGIVGIEKLIGGTGSDTVAGSNVGDTFNVTADNAGNVTVTTTNGTTTTTTTLLTFSGIENLNGGTGADLFVIANGKKLSGKVDGTNGVANVAGAFDELDYSAFTTAVMVDLTGQDMSGGDGTGTATNIGGVSHISDVFGGSGNDVLTGDSKDNFLFGNGGNDALDGGNSTLIAGAGNNVLVGGDGNDTLKVTGSVVGNRNLLLGGLGKDNLTGGVGQDILFNGTTSFDTDVTTLAAIETFWTGAGTFDNRVTALRNGTATNGTTAVGVALNSTTVFDDTSVDTLTGGGGNNWFFVKLTSPNVDIVTDLTASDVEN